MERLKSIDIAVEYATKRTDKRLKMNAAKFLATQDLRKVRGAIETLLRDDDRDVREVTLTALMEGSVDKPDNYQLTRAFYPWRPLTQLSLIFLGFFAFCVITAFLLWFIPPKVATTPDAWLLIVLKHFGRCCQTNANRSPASNGVGALSQPEGRAILGERRFSSI